MAAWLAVWYGHNNIKSKDRAVASSNTRVKKKNRGDFNNVVIPHNKNQRKNRISSTDCVTFDRFTEQNVCSRFLSYISSSFFFNAVQIFFFIIYSPFLLTRAYRTNTIRNLHTLEHVMCRKGIVGPMLPMPVPSPPLPPITCPFHGIRTHLRTHQHTQSLCLYVFI